MERVAERIAKVGSSVLSVLIILAVADLIGVVDVKWFWERAKEESPENLKASVSALQKDVASLKSEIGKTRSDCAKAQQEARSAAAAAQQAASEAKSAADAANAVRGRRF